MAIVFSKSRRDAKNPISPIFRLDSLLAGIYFPCLAESLFRFRNGSGWGEELWRLERNALGSFPVSPWLAFCKPDATFFRFQPSPHRIQDPKKTKPGRSRCKELPRFPPWKNNWRVLELRLARRRTNIGNSTGPNARIPKNPQP